MALKVNTGGIILNLKTINSAVIKNNVVAKHILTLTLSAVFAALILVETLHLEKIFGIGIVPIILSFIVVVYSFVCYPWGYTALYKKHAYLGLMVFVMTIFTAWWGTTGFPPLFDITDTLYYQIVTAIAALVIFWRYYAHLAFVSKIS